MSCGPDLQASCPPKTLLSSDVCELVDRSRTDRNRWVKQLPHCGRRVSARPFTSVDGDRNIERHSISGSDFGCTLSRSRRIPYFAASDWGTAVFNWCCDANHDNGGLR